MSQHHDDASRDPQGPQAPPSEAGRSWSPAPWSYTLRPFPSAWPSADPPGEREQGAPAAPGHGQPLPPPPPAAPPPPAGVQAPPPDPAAQPPPAGPAVQPQAPGPSAQPPFGPATQPLPPGPGTQPSPPAWRSAGPATQPLPPGPGTQAPAPAWRSAPAGVPTTDGSQQPADAAPGDGSGTAVARDRGAAGGGAAAPAGGQASGVDTTGRENHPGTNQSEASWNLDAHVEFYDVYKAFGSFRVLDGVTFRIPRGGVTVLMGPSGTGKSVALRHLVGLLMPDKGDIVVDGMHVPQLNDRDLLRLRRSVGMLFQDGALFSSMNLYDNVAFPLRQHTRKSEAEVREVVVQRLSEVGLAGAEKRMPNELSGGMRKRAGFARGLVMEPRLFLVDEPDSGLDPVRTTLLCDLIKEIAKKYQATVIVVSHNVEAVRRIADYVGILYKGKMRHFGTLDEIQRSHDEFVRQFFNADAEGPLGMD